MWVTVRLYICSNINLQSNLSGVVKYNRMQEMGRTKFVKGGKFCNKPHTLPREQMSVQYRYILDLLKVSLPSTTAHPAL